MNNKAGELMTEQWNATVSKNLQESHKVTQRISSKRQEEGI